MDKDFSEKNPGSLEAKIAKVEADVEVATRNDGSWLCQDSAQAIGQDSENWGHAARDR